jgi:hypothetical protein
VQCPYNTQPQTLKTVQHRIKQKENIKATLSAERKLELTTKAKPPIALHCKTMFVHKV